MPPTSLNALYQQLILEHYRHPHNKSDLPGGDLQSSVCNPVCGDEVTLQLKVDEERILDARFSGHGCSISQASVSMMTDVLTGRTFEEAEALASRFGAMMMGDREAAKDASLGDLTALQGVSRFSVRVPCALLGFKALRNAMASMCERDDLEGSVH